MSESTGPPTNHMIYEEESPNDCTDMDHSLRDALASIEPSERMHRDLDEASKMMTNMMESLDSEFKNGGEGCVVKRRSRNLSSNALNRLGIVSTLSNSEPGKSNWQVGPTGN